MAYVVLFRHGRGDDALRVFLATSENEAQDIAATYGVYTYWVAQLDVREYRRRREAVDEFVPKE